MGGIDQLKSGVEIPVVVVADLGDQSKGVIADAARADLQSIGGSMGYGDDPAMAVQQRQRNDP